MADETQLTFLKQGSAVWNQWRKQNNISKPNFTSANLTGVDLHNVNLTDADLMKANLSYANLICARLVGADLSEADITGARLAAAKLRYADLTGARLVGADIGIVNQLVGANHFYGAADLTCANLMCASLRGADLTGARLVGADLREADLTDATLVGADLRDADLSSDGWLGTRLRRADLAGANLSGAKLIKTTLVGANLTETNLYEANLTEADLTAAQLVETNFEKATLSRCCIYGISAWGLKLNGTKQENLRITPLTAPAITVDNLDAAQFIYLLLENEKLRSTITAITSKVVLILGRFTDKRKEVLTSIKDKLREYDYLPVLFDFEKPLTRDFTETVLLLAHLSKFIIADITEPKGVPHELATIIPTLEVPIMPLIQGSETPYAFADDFKKYCWYLSIYRYDTPSQLVESLKENVIAPLEERAKELEARKNSASSQR